MGKATGGLVAGAATLMLGSVPADGAGAGSTATSYSYSGSSGQSVYASFVVRSGKVVGLFVGGVCSPNTSLVEDGVNRPLPIRSGRWLYNQGGTRIGATVRGERLAPGRWSVRFTLRNKRSGTRCAYKVIARRTSPAR